MRIIRPFRKSFDEIYDLKPEQLQLGFLKVLKGSYMFEHAGGIRSDLSIEATL